MNRKENKGKQNLLSIGEISKLTGASIRSLRYYEKIGLLTPTYINPESAYRYYTFEQTYLIDMIMLCIEMDLPLKNVKAHMDGENTVDYLALISYGREATQKKLEALQKKLAFINDAEMKIKLAEEYYHSGEHYQRPIKEKYFFTMPHEQAFDNLQPMEVTNFYTALFQHNDLPMEALSWEFGLLLMKQKKHLNRYVFWEIDYPFEHPHVITIPAGDYRCMQNDNSVIEDAADIFDRELANKKQWLAIETEIYHGKQKITRPVHELRVISY